MAAPMEPQIWMAELKSRMAPYFWMELLMDATKVQQKDNSRLAMSEKQMVQLTEPSRARGTE